MREPKPNASTTRPLTGAKMSLQEAGLTSILSRHISFVKELEEVMRLQVGEIAVAMLRLGEKAGTSLPAIVEGLWNRDDHDPNIDPDSAFSSMSAYYFRKMADLLYGHYRCDSYFYNTSEYTARLFKSDMEKIKQNPEEWALVMFDYHD